MRWLFTALALSVVLPLGTVRAQSTATLTDAKRPVGAAATRALGRYLVGQFGTSVIYERELRCANRSLCRAELMPDAQAAGRARRQVFHHALLEGRQAVNFGVREAVVTCNTYNCQVRGASGFIQVEEPVSRGDTVFIAVNSYENAATTVLIHSFLVRMVGSQSVWKEIAMDRLGYTK